MGNKEIAMFRINRREKGKEKLEFLGFNPIYKWEEWELLSIGKTVEDCNGQILMNENELKTALEKGIGRMDVESDEFNNDNDYRFDTVYSKYVNNLTEEEKRHLQF